MNIFVFGSNLAGRHGKGAALFARQKYGAIYGQGEGIQGCSYGIPTKDENLRSLSLARVVCGVNVFKQFAVENHHLTFILTPIGCGLAGFTVEQIAPLFDDAPENVVLPVEFKRVLELTNRGS